jgi:hypothetical protein
MALFLVCGAGRCAPPPSPSQVHEVRGVVVEQGTGRPVHDADVGIPGTEQHAVTNSSGQFALCYVRAGTVDVRASVQGGDPVLRRVSVPQAAGQPLTLELPAGTAGRRIIIREATPLVIGDTTALVVDGTRRAWGVYDGCNLQGPGAEGWRTLRLTPDVVSSVEVYYGPTARQQFGFPHALVVTTRRFERP